MTNVAVVDLLAMTKMLVGFPDNHDLALPDPT